MTPQQHFNKILEACPLPPIALNPYVDKYGVGYYECQGTSYVQKTIRWGEFGTPSIKDLALKLAKQQYNITENPKVIMISDIEVELEYANFRLILDKSLLLAKHTFR